MERNYVNNAKSLNAYKRGPSLEVSRWYKGNLTTNLAEKDDTNGRFSLIDATIEPGNEPPPHIHFNEDELFYVLEGEFDVYVGEQAFKVGMGECVFMPRFKPHAFVIRSTRLRVLTLFAPGGLEGAFQKMSQPAESLEIPKGMETYSTADLTKTVELLSQYGIRILSHDEIAEQLPLYPRPVVTGPGVSQL
jgi:mannose-6-phosphate isomerase-like protein (cupin superfamily)